MTDQEYCRKMAELEGKKIITDSEGKQFEQIIYRGKETVIGLPDYRKDLNAQARVTELLQDQLCNATGVYWSCDIKHPYNNELPWTVALSGGSFWEGYEGEHKDLKEALWRALCKAI